MAIDFSEILSSIAGEAGSDERKKFLKGAGKAALTGLAGRRERKRSEEARLAGLAEREKAFKEQFGQGKKTFEQQLEMLRNMPSMTQESEDFVQQQKNVAEELLGRAGQRGQEQRADVVSAAQSGDPRNTAQLLNVLEGMGASEDAARDKALQMKAGASGTAANLAERTQQFKTGLEKQLMDRAGMSADEARRALLDINTAQESAAPMAQADSDATMTALATLMKEYDLGNPGAKKGEAGMRYMADQGFKTKGEFSHERNKKAVIDEEDGKKEAELTGGEIVFNPDQTSEMEALIANGNSEELMEYMKELLSKPQFQD
tara:strand:- start:557 stop:1510 length:954 start_codon:yes stop_codon:yes gene_type:complete